MINQMVLSTEIEWIGYESARNMLQIEFIDGEIYQYDSVPENVYRDFLIAPSYCGYLAAHIKGRYPYRRVR